MRSSWDTEEMNSFFIFSVSARPCAIRLMLPRNRSSSSRGGSVSGRRISSSPRAMSAAARSTWPSGTTMLRTKYSPEDAAMHSATAPAARPSSTALKICRRISARLVTSRMAAISSAA